MALGVGSCDTAPARLECAGRVPSLGPVSGAPLGTGLFLLDFAMTFGSLFSGIGAGDLALERVGMKCVWQVENDKRKRVVLEWHWPNVSRPEDVRDCDLETVELICGGDPCPSRSRARARGDRPSNHPDLSGYFLAVVGRLRPRWVVRENVPAPDAVHFAAALELLGYRTTALAFDSRDFTGQSRRRDYLCSCNDAGTSRAFERVVSDSC